MSSTSEGVSGVLPSQASSPEGQSPKVARCCGYSSWRPTGRPVMTARALAVTSSTLAIGPLIHGALSPAQLDVEPRA